MHDIKDDERAHAQLIEQFIKITNAAHSYARHFLEENEWDVGVSVLQYNRWSKKSEEPASVSPSTSDGKVEESSNSENGDPEQQRKWYWNNMSKHFEMPSCALVLPNLNAESDEFRQFLENGLIETTILKKLEHSGHLNWWWLNGCGQRLWPLCTSGDGNCLLHAASLGLWGHHDRYLTLRKTLHEMITEGSRRHTLYRRWRFAESKANQASGLTLTDEEWQKEWKILLNAASTTPRKTGGQRDDMQTTTSKSEEENVSISTEEYYASLETIHVFALAHVLKRSIIVVSDTVLRNANGEELAPIPFGGIYLPLECPSEQCIRSPLVLCYDSAHFSPLVSMRTAPDNPLLPIMPIVDKDRNLLPVHFCVDPGPDFTWWKDAEDDQMASRIELSEADRLSLICEYMDVTKIEIRRGSHHWTVGARHLNNNSNNNSSFGSGNERNKSITLACGGDLAKKHHSSRIIYEIAQQIRKTFRSSSKRKNKNKRNYETISAADLLFSHIILAAHLDSEVHESVKLMLDSYISSAKERFEKVKDIPSSAVPKQRNRISRSFSTSSLRIKCINSDCEKTASQSTNFLCSDCFEYQKQFMASFGTRPGQLRSLRSATAIDRDENNTINIAYSDGADAAAYEKRQRNRCRSVKSNTMPLLSSNNDNNVNSNNDNNNINISDINVRNQHYESKCNETPRHIVHTVAVHNAQHPSQSITTKVSSIKGANGVTHYYVTST